MVARIELQTKGVSETGEQLVGTSVLAEISDKRNGRYDTPLGVIGVHYQPKIPLLGVIIDCTEAPTLQGSRSVTERRLVVGKKGESSQQISPTETLIVNLDKRIEVTSSVEETDLGRGPSMGDRGSGHRYARRTIYDW